MNIIKLGIEKMVAVFDDSAQLYEIFSDGSLEVYLGCADSIKEAKEVAVWTVEDKKGW